jgi:molecular chaperone GrpE
MDERASTDTAALSTQLDDTRHVPVTQPDDVESTTADSAPENAGIPGMDTELAQLLLTELRGVRRDFETKLLYDDSKQRQLDTMHAELQDYRNGLHFQLLRPIIMDLITLHGDLGKVAERLRREHPDAEAASGVTDIEHQRDQVEEILQRNGVERYTCPDDAFDRERQRAIGVVETHDATLNQRIAERVRPGFLYEGRRVIQAEQVKTYSYVPVPADV